MIHGRKECWWGSWYVELLQQFQDGTALIKRPHSGRMYRVLYSDLSFR